MRHAHDVAIGLAKTLGYPWRVAAEAVAVLDAWYLLPVVVIFPAHYLAIAALFEAKQSRAAAERVTLVLDDLVNVRRFFYISSQDMDGTQWHSMLV